MHQYVLIYVCTVATLPVNAGSANKNEYFVEEMHGITSPGNDGSNCLIQFKNFQDKQAPTCHHFHRFF